MKRPEGTIYLRRWTRILSMVMVGSLCIISGVAWSDEPAQNTDSAAPAAAENNEAAPTPSEAAPPAKTKWYKGSFSTGIDGVWGHGGDMDLSLDQMLQFQVDPPQFPKIHVRGSFWLQENFDSGDSRHSTLRDIDDSFQSDVQFRPSYLYLDIDDLWLKSTLRIGRQRILDGVVNNRIDGFYFKQRVKQWDWYLFAGTRATFYGENFKNPVVGGGASYRPFSKTKIALDLYYAHERRAIDQTWSLHNPVAMWIYGWGERDIKKEVNDVSISLSAWQTVCQYLTMFGRFTWEADNGDELTLNASGYIPEPWDITYELTYRHQFNSIGDRVNDLTGYYRTLGKYESYDHLFMAVHRPIIKNIVFSLEGDLHYTQDSAFANRDYQRFAAVLSGEKLLGKVALDAKIGVERWNVSEGEGTWAITGEIGRRWKTVQVALGTDFQRYEDRITKYNNPLKAIDMIRVWFAPGALQFYNPLLLFYDHYTVQMHENVYTVYAKTKWAITKNQDLNVQLTFEEDDGPDAPYWRVQAGYTIRF